ncbi:vWA domain-containing protein [Xylophilus sp. ASV27]|uniref:vWA domain-containing protein n=1 Tax=Xylophilus sp. ASV27 TaxID=2795129 RepID=UPI0018EE43F1|nr:VWA domain-containing protein [Xylophilus sp. ASV27]
MQLGDARSGKLADNIAGFGRTLRRAGVPTDSARVALACEAALVVGVADRSDLRAALEAVLVQRAQDIAVFRELFDAYFRDPEIAHKLLAQMLPRAEGRADPPKRRPRVREALAAPTGTPRAAPDERIDLDAAMSASRLRQLRHADFAGLGAAEYRLVQRLARDIPLPLPQVAGRRTQAGPRGARPDWPAALRQAVRSGGELMQLPRRARRPQPPPLLLLVDVSGSMERYARLLLAFLHAATRGLRAGGAGRCDVFAFGTGLTDLTPAFRLADTDAMLAAAGERIDDYAGGTRLGEALSALGRQHARRLVGRRTLVLLVTDGLDTGEPAELDAALARLRRHTGPLLWLNPLLRFDGYAPLARGAAVLHRHADGMLAVHNLARLDALAAGIAAVLRT